MPTSIQRERWIDFDKQLTDLVQNSDFDCELHPDDIRALEFVFSISRKKACERLKKTVAELQEDDNQNPAFLGVSLLRVLDGTGLRETAHTRLLCWILNPYEKHGFSYLPLRAFLETVMSSEQWPWTAETVLSNVEIVAERTLKGVGSLRRTDILIQGQMQAHKNDTPLHWLIIVEAKVEAGESNDQLSDYEQEAEKWKNKRNGENQLSPCLIFLTPDGRGGVSGKGWKPIKMRDLCELLWRAVKVKPDAPGFHLTRYYLAGVLSDVYGWELPITNAEKSDSIYKKINYLLLSKVTSRSTEVGK